MCNWGWVLITCQGQKEGEDVKKGAKADYQDCDTQVSWMAFKPRLKRGDDAARGGEQSTPEQTTWRKAEAPEGAI